MPETRVNLLPGLLLVGAVAVLAVWIHALPFAPFTIDGRHPVDSLLVAVVLGVALRNLVALPAACTAGVQYSVQSLLPAAIVLMGAKLDFSEVLRASGQALAISLLCVAVAMVLTLALCRWVGVRAKLAMLIAVGTAICGGTAIAVTAPAIEAEEDDTAFAIATITLFGLLAIFAFPVLGELLGLDQTQFGVWAGVAIHATPQVMAAAYSYGVDAGDTAVIVKLVRVLLLAPLLVGIGAWYAREQRRHQQAYVAQRPSLTTLFPPFIAGFLLLALAHSLHLLPDFTLHLQDSPLWGAQSLPITMAEAVTSVSSFLITAAMVGVGLGVNLRSLARLGWTAAWVGLFAAVVLSGFSLLLVEAAL